MSASHDSGRMQCMEVWGGNQETDRHFELPGLRVWVNSNPDGDSTAGGDVYYLSSCASGRITRALLADVAGHGESASEVAIGLRNLMRDNINVIRQERLVAEMNRRFSEFTTETRFATAIVSTYFAPTRTMMLSNAGHPPPFLYSARTRTWTAVEQKETPGSQVSGTPWGVYDDAIYPTYRMKLDEGDRVLCYSDALIETGPSPTEQIGVEGLLQRLNERGELASEQVIPFAIESLHQMSAEHRFDDDATLVLLEATGTKVPFKQGLLAPFRLLRPVRLKTGYREGVAGRS